MKVASVGYILISLYSSLTLAQQGQSGGSSSQKLIGFSNYFNQVIQLSDRSFRIFAGNTGTPCTGSGQFPCNSCNSPVALTDGSLASSGLVCNDKQIYPDLLFTVTMRSTSPQAYPIGCTNLIIGLDGTTLIPPVQVTQYTPQVANQDITASWQWSTLCNAFSGSPNCKASFSKTFRVGFNSNCSNTTLLDGSIEFNISFRYVNNSPFMSFGCPENTMGPYEGYCDYTVFPGDKKLYILNSAANVANALLVGDRSTATDLSASTSSDASGIKYSAVRAYYAEGNFNQITLQSNYVDIPISLTGGLIDRRIQGLDNDKKYSVIIANKDEAGNVELFAYPSNVNNSIAMSDSDTPIGSTQASVPQPVVGLLDDQRCFIATAAFGNPNDPQVKVLRNFRDSVLIKSKIGKDFVNWYYKWSPKVAEKVATSEILRKIVRAILWPVVWLAELAQAKEGHLDQPTDDERDFISTSPENQHNRSEVDANQKTKKEIIWPESEAFIASSNEIRSGKKKIDHPLEKRGLIRINADGSYDYAVYGEKRVRTSVVTIYNLPQIHIQGVNGKFQDFYGSSYMSIVSGGLEWLIFPESNHNLSYRISGGVGSVTGSGILSKDLIQSEERYTLYMLPVTAHLIYRLDYFNNQWIAPYGSGGGGYTGLIELRDDAARINFSGTPYVEVGGGLLISLMRIDPKSMFVLKRDYEISDIWINLEAKLLKSLKKDVNFDGFLMGAGLVLDF